MDVGDLGEPSHANQDIEGVDKVMAARDACAYRVHNVFVVAWAGVCNQGDTAAPACRAVKFYQRALKVRGGNRSACEGDVHALGPHAGLIPVLVPCKQFGVDKLINLEVLSAFSYNIEHGL